MQERDNKGMAHKVGLTLLLLGLLGAMIVVATFAAFSDTTDDSGNRWDAGSVAISDNDDGSRALYDLFDGTPLGKPGSSDSGCIKVTFDGSLDSVVNLYASNDLNANPLDDQLTLTITSGTGPAVNNECTATDFTAAGTTGDVYNGSLANFMSTYNDYADNLALDAGGDAVWSTDESVTYKFEVTLIDDADVNDANSKLATGFATGLHSFTWEARENQ
jgi:predicted ribosomally synthesized peptide with SipW-like signal peptide